MLGLDGKGGRKCAPITGREARTAAVATQRRGRAIGGSCAPVKKKLIWKRDEQMEARIVGRTCA